MQDYKLLILKFFDKTISKEERKVLDEWVLESESNRAFFKNSVKESENKFLSDFDSNKAYQKFSNAIASKKSRRLLPYSMMKYAAVLVALFVIGFFVKDYIFDIGRDTTIPNINNIVITLSDGSMRVITSEDTDLITDKDGHVIANKGKNSLAFDSNISPLASDKLHEIFIPYSKTFKLSLSDGTVVWLNSGSKLRFPQRFSESSNNRTVYLDGEAFFEVTKNIRKSFIVNTNGVDIKVLGTKFNVSSYENDKTIATTLIEGAVSIYKTKASENELRLGPNDHAIYNKFENSFSKQKVDTDIYTAWMQNRLVIDNLNFSEILTKLERRHHVTIVNKVTYLNNASYKGEFVDEGIESILKTISLSTPFNYEINKKVITITE